MTDIVDQLKADHHNIACILKAIEAELDKAEAGSQPDYELVTHAMRYMTEYPDVLHHPREDVLFEQLRREDPELEHVVEKLQHEHEFLTRQSQTYFDAVRAVTVDQVVDLEQLLTLGREFIAAQFRHMQFEETELLPLVRTRLSQLALIELNYVTQARNDPLFGDSVEESYQELFDYVNSLSGEPAE